MENKLIDYPYKTARHFMSVPFILGMSLPLIVLDFTMEIYHRIAFTLYNIPTVDRGKYIRIDRHKLEYLEPMDKAWCAYCGYANGLLSYAKEIARETEKYWCGIKHKDYEDFNTPAHHAEFLEYGDEEAYKNRYK